MNVINKYGLSVYNVSVTFFVAIMFFLSMPVSTMPLPFNGEEKELQQNYPRNISLTDKIYTFSTIWTEIKYNFVNIDHISFNPDSLYYATIPSVIGSKDDIEYYNTLRRFICSFGDGHTALLRTSDDTENCFDYVPDNIQNFGDKFYFTTIRKISGADSTLLGAEIVEIEGMPTLEYVQKFYFPYIAASTYNNKLLQVTKTMGEGIKGTYFKGKAKKLNGEIVSFSIERNGDATYTKDNAYWNIQKPVKREAIDLVFEKDIALLTINTFRESVKTQIDSLMQIVNSKAKGLIIDLRNNGGGDTEIAQHLQKYLTKGDYFLSFGSQTRVNNAYDKSQGNYRKEYEDYYLEKAYQTEKPDTIFIENEIKRINCPVVILIGNYSFSACEDFLVNIYEVPNRPILIGEETGGSTGAPLVISNLPNKTLVRICTLRILFPYSLKPFVNEGIHPDIIVKENFEDFLLGKDKVLENALKTFL